MLKEPPNNDNRLSRVLSSISSFLSIPPWHECSSTGVSTMETTLFSRGSHDTSITSFNLTDSPNSLDDGRCSDAPEVKQWLTQSPINAEQADAHVPHPPSPTPLKSRFSDYSDPNDDDDESIGEICFVSSSRTTEANKILAPAARTRSISGSLSWYQAFCEAHPEYDSDLDRDTDTAESFLTLPLEDDVGSGAGHETSASDIPTPGPDPLPHSIPYEIIPTPPPSSSLPTPPPCYIRPCIFSTRAASLSDKETRTSHKHDRALSGTYGQKSSGTKSGVRWFLSIILPCIPVVTEETEKLDEKDECSRKQDGARRPEVMIAANDRHLTGTRENHDKKAGRKRSCTTLFW